MLKSKMYVRCPADKESVYEPHSAGDTKDYPDSGKPYVLILKDPSDL